MLFGSEKCNEAPFQVLRIALRLIGTFQFLVKSRKADRTLGSKLDQVALDDAESSIPYGTRLDCDRPRCCVCRFGAFTAWQRTWGFDGVRAGLECMHITINHSISYTYNSNEKDYDICRVIILNSYVRQHSATRLVVALPPCVWLTRIQMLAARRSSQLWAGPQRFAVPLSAGPLSAVPS